MRKNSEFCGGNLPKSGFLWWKSTKHGKFKEFPSINTINSVSRPTKRPSEDLSRRRRSRPPSPRGRRDDSRPRHSYRQDGQSYRSQGPPRGSGPRGGPSGTKSDSLPIGPLGNRYITNSCSIINGPKKHGTPQSSTSSASLDGHLISRVLGTGQRGLPRQPQTPSRALTPTEELSGVNAAFVSLGHIDKPDLVITSSRYCGRLS